MPMLKLHLLLCPGQATQCQMLQRLPLQRLASSLIKLLLTLPAQAMDLNAQILVWKA